MSSKEDSSVSASVKNPSDPTRFFDFLGSVKFGIVLLGLLIVVSIAGMLLPQYNVPGFDVFFAKLSDSQQTVFGALGLFDIYGSWYFNAILSLLALNIILASIEQFPKTRKLVTRPNLEPSPAWIRSQKLFSEIEVSGPVQGAAQSAADACRRLGWRRIAIRETGGRAYVFAESGAWNRYGAYVVHIALLTILAGGFITSHFSYSGQLPLTVGESSAQINELVFRDNQSAFKYRQLPFTVACLDLEQRLIDPTGPLESANSLDWLTHLEFSDETGRRRAVIQLNRPVDYRGFRLFHSTFLTMGKARSIRIQAAAEETVEDQTIERNGTVTLRNGSTLRFIDFRSNLSLSRDTSNENSVNYENPAAILEARSPDGERRTVFAFRDNQPGDRARMSSFSGISLRLMDFEKVSDRHVLIVRRDPGAAIVYSGFGLLIGSLLAVFLFSHQRVWCAIESISDERCRLTFGGHTNRNDLSFEKKLKRLFDSPKRA